LIGILVSGGGALLVAVVLVPLLIRRQVSRGVGQQIRLEGPQRHFSKAGTPTVGGVGILVAVTVGYLVAHLHLGISFSRGGILVVAVTLAMGAVGLVDDVAKIRHQRNLGLTKLQKFGAQILVALAFGVLAHVWAHVPTAITFVRLPEFGIGLGTIGWIAFAAITVVATSNAVNLTDGLDGLASGASIFAFGALALLGYWMFRHEQAYRVDNGLDLAVLSIAFVGAVAGFLWWNAPPAKIFMGDVGSLGLGSGLAALALVMHLDLLLIVLGGLFVLETVSVIVQVFSFRVFGKRVFRMAPIHHHFELKGWPETTVLIRLWIVAGMVTAVAIGAFYADYLALGSGVK